MYEACSTIRNKKKKKRISFCSCLACLHELAVFKSIISVAMTVKIKKKTISQYCCCPTPLLQLIVLCMYCALHDIAEQEKKIGKTCAFREAWKIFFFIQCLAKKKFFDFFFSFFFLVLFSLSRQNFGPGFPYVFCCTVFFFFFFFSMCSKLLSITHPKKK